MDLPVDPTTSDATPGAIIQSLPDQASLRRILEATSLRIDADRVSEVDEFVEKLDPVQARTLASQIRFAAPQRIFYYRVPELAIQIDALSEEIDDSRSRHLVSHLGTAK
jgi:hypothetical protein